MSRVFQPQTGEPRLREHDTRIRLGVNRDPLYFARAVPGDARRVQIVPEHTMQSGADILRVPFRPYVGDDPLPQELSSALTYTLDLDNTGLADGTTVGGRIDGIALAANTDYLIWAFLSTALNGTIEGIGITTRPQATGITMPNPAGLGGTGIVVTVGTNLGNRFAIGARVLFRNGITAGSSWNQAIVTATAANTITVDLDASYGLTTNNNTTLTSVGSVTCLQLDNMQPRVGGETTSYNSDQPYSYIGSIQTDDSSNIRGWRKRGDFLPIAAGVVNPVNRTGITATETFQPGLGNWIPVGAKEVRMTVVALITAGTPGNALVVAAPDGITANTTTLIQRAGISGVAQYSTADLHIRTRDCSYFHSYTETGTITVTHISNLIGHMEDGW